MASSEEEAREVRPQRSVGLLVALLAVGGAIWALFSYTPKPPQILSVDQLPERNLDETQVYHLQGMLVSGSVRYREYPCEHRFRLANDGKEIDVHYSGCVLPDSLVDIKGIPTRVAVEGRLAAEGHFQAHQVFAKVHPREAYTLEMIKPLRME